MNRMYNEILDRIWKKKTAKSYGLLLSVGGLVTPHTTFGIPLRATTPNLGGPVPEGRGTRLNQGASRSVMFQQI